MFHNRKLNGCISKSHERVPRLTYGDDHSTFEEPLGKDNSMTIHLRSLNSLAIEICKVERYCPSDYEGHVPTENLIITEGRNEATCGHTQLWSSTMKILRSYGI